MTKAKVISVVFAAISVSACMSIPLAPGAERVKITRLPAEVSSCRALGNLDLDAPAAGVDNAKNHAVGLGGDTVLDTTPTAIWGNAMPLRTGVIYRCGSGAAPASK
jgi:hypothetical protein